MSVKFRVSSFCTAYGDRDRCRKSFSVGTGRTKQAFKDECDVNNILRRYRKTMGIDFLNQYQGYLHGQFGDVSAAPEYSEALAKIREGEAAFEAMPSNLRARFGNDPVQFLDFMGDVDNRDEAIALGLLNRPVVTSEFKSDVVSPGK